MQPHPIGQVVETGSGSSESSEHMLSHAWRSLVSRSLVDIQARRPNCWKTLRMPVLGTDVLRSVNWLYSVTWQLQVADFTWPNTSNHSEPGLGIPDQATHPTSSPNISSLPRYLKPTTTWASGPFSIFLHLP